METRNRMLGEGVKLKSAEFLIIIQWHKKGVFFTSSLKKRGPFVLKKKKKKTEKKIFEILYFYIWSPLLFFFFKAKFHFTSLYRWITQLSGVPMYGEEWLLLFAIVFTNNSFSPIVSDILQNEASFYRVVGAIQSATKWWHQGQNETGRESECQYPSQECEKYYSCFLVYLYELLTHFLWIWCPI